MNAAQELIAMVDERGEFVTSKDGFVYYWPDGYVGAIKSWELRTIAAELDRRNADADNSIDSQLARLRNDLPHGGSL